MRVLLLCLAITVGALLPARAEAQSSRVPERGWAVAFGPHLIRRENSSKLHIGGGLTVARRFGRLAGVAEIGGTRREGHNDWRIIGGPRLMFGGGARTSFFVQALAGTLIRQKTSDWAVLPGFGINVRWTGARAVRFQLDAPIERSQARTVAGVRASIWLAFH